MNLAFSQQYGFRAMQITDLGQVVAIEQRVSQSPWSPEQFQQSLNESTVLVTGETIIGFFVVASIVDEAEIHNVAVHPDYQGLGLGSLLLDYLIAQLPVSVSIVHLEVMATNYRAIRLYLQRNFVQVGERRGYYKTEYGREDGLLMSLPVAGGGD